LNTPQVDFHDIRVLKSSGLSIFIDNGEIEQISNNYTSGTACRALVNGSWGIVSSDNTGDPDSMLFSAAKLSGQAHRKSPRPDIELARVESPLIHDLPVVEKDPADIPIEEKVELLLAIHKRAKVQDVSSSTVMYSESVTDVEYSNSEGVEVSYSQVRTGFAVTAVASRNGVFQMGRESKFDVCGYELFDRYDALELAETAGNTARDLLSASGQKAAGCL